MDTNKTISRPDSRVAWAIGVILIHLAVSIVHGLAHSRLGIGLNAFQKVFIDAVIVVMPLVAGILFWRNKLRAGGAVLSISMAGALFFGIYYHFLAPGADNVNHQFALAIASWNQLFDATAIGIAVLEIVGTILGIRLIFKAHGTS